MISNYHTHCEFCDGKASAAEMARAAYEGGHSVLGFSSHSPLPFHTAWNMDGARFPEYLGAIRALSEEYSGRMEILAGLEIDYIEGLCGPADALYADAKLDYRLGAVHFVRPLRDGKETLFTVDEPRAKLEAHLAEAWDGDGMAMARDYYRDLAEMTRRGGFDILAHLDLVRVNNSAGRYFDEASAGYRDAVMETVDLLHGSGIIVEINTGGMARGKTDSPYPSAWILRELFAKGVGVTVNADAHRTIHLASHRAEGIRAAQAAGYRTLAVLTGRGRIEVPIE